MADEERTNAGGEKKNYNPNYRKKKYHNHNNQPRNGQNERPANQAEGENRVSQAGNVQNNQNSPKQGYDRQFKNRNWKNQNQNRQRFEKKQKAEETKEDIIRDCARVEKEIELEIKEIETIRMSFS